MLAASLSLLPELLLFGQLLLEDLLLLLLPFQFLLQTRLHLPPPESWEGRERHPCQGK